jgi:hypothetical protein
MSLAWGGSAGVAGPLGLVGTFVEFRPVRYAAINVGVGAGGSFGPAAATWLSIDPISLRSFSLGVTANASTNLAIVRGVVLPGRRELPTVTGWLGVGVQAQFRPTRSTFVRLGAGYQWLLDVQRFRIGTDDELSGAGVPRFFFATPLDAVRAAAREEAYGLPFAHIDLGTYWRL